MIIFSKKKFLEWRGTTDLTYPIPKWVDTADGHEVKDRRIQNVDACLFSSEKWEIEV